MAKKGEKRAALHSAIRSYTEDCILWPYGKDSYGYGVATFDGKSTHTNRIVCIMVHGDPPDIRLHAYYAAHSCGTPACINPRHLRWATPTENQADRIKDGTTQRRSRLLSDEQVRYARSMRDLKSGCAIADELGVHNGSISALFAGKTYKEVA